MAEGAETMKTPGRHRMALAWGPPLLAVAGAALVLRHFAQAPEVRFDDFALGRNTVSVFAQIDGHLIHGKTLEDLPEVARGVRARGKSRVILWLGNSQLHAINQAKPGDLNAAPIAHAALEDTPYDLVAFSQPNASLMEHYLLFEHLRHTLPVQIVVLPLVFDDTRESGIRPGLTAAIKDPETRSALEKTEVGRFILSIAKKGVLAGGGADFAGLKHTVQDSVERWLNAQLEHTSAIWKARPQLRGRLMTSLYRLRNTVFGIKPTSKRKMIPARYQTNLDALKESLASARAHGIAVLAYIAPLRDDVEPPYVKTEYERFKRDTSALCGEYGARFLDLEHLVPAAEWGKKDATNVNGEPEIDFMHFQAAGHRRLALAVVAALRKIIDEQQ